MGLWFVSISGCGGGIVVVYVAGFCGFMGFDLLVAVVAVLWW